MSKNVSKSKKFVSTQQRTMTAAKLEKIQELLESLSDEELRTYFVETYDFEPCFEVTYKRLRSFEKNFGRGPISDRDVVARMIDAEKLNQSDLFRVLTRRVTPAMLKTYFDQTFGFEPDIPLETFDDLRIIRRVYKCKCECGSITCDLNSKRLSKAAQAGWINMFNAVLSKIDNYKDALNQAYIMAADSGQLQIVKRCVELGADEHVGALCCSEERIFEWIAKQFPAALPEYEKIYHEANL